MKKASLLLVLFLMAVSAFCQPWDGPFGLKMGLTYNQLKEVDPDIESPDNWINDEYRYFHFLNQVPISHHEFDEYTLNIVPRLGLTQIHAGGGCYSSADSQTYLKRISELAAILDNKYGRHIDKSYWEVPDSGTKYLVPLYYWNEQSNAVLNNDIAEIILTVATSGLVAMSMYLIEETESDDVMFFGIGIVYTFTNHATYLENIEYYMNAAL